MDRTKFSLEVFGDRLPLRYSVFSEGDNSRRIQKLKQGLKTVMDSELSDRQREVVDMFYFKRMNVTEISKEMGLNKSTVSRHLNRAVQKLSLAMKYSMIPVWLEEQ